MSNQIFAPGSRASVVCLIFRQARTAPIDDLGLLSSAASECGVECDPGIGRGETRQSNEALGVAPDDVAGAGLC